MKLLSFSCQNIWPFFDRTVSVNFLDGKYLVKAPIGSGKSFLFFDGPVFGLYKYGQRQMLSIKAEAGYIKICFEHNGEILVCVRDITRTKSGNDTIKSSIFVIEDDISHVQKLLSPYSVLTRDIDSVWQIINECKNRRVECKNETDVQTTLSEFIPPQEVFLSTSMLLQGSENVFELAPADRISLFKEIFGLMSIDSATDKINDERKAAWALLKSKNMTDDVDAKLRLYLENLFVTAKNIERYAPAEITPLLDEINQIKEKISITWYALDEKRHSILETINTTLLAKYNEQQQALWAIEWQQNIVLWLQKELSDNEKESGQCEKELTKIEQELANNTISDTKQEKIQRQQKYDTWFASLPQEWFIGNEKSFQYVLDTYQEKVQEWKLLSEQQKFAEQTITQLTEKSSEDKTVLETYSQQLESLQKDYDAKKKFECIKIWADCPFIETINEWLFNGLKRNITTAEKNRNEYLAKITWANTADRIKAEQANLETIKAQIATLKESVFIKNHTEIKSAKNTYDTLLIKQQEILRTEKLYSDQLQHREDSLKKQIQLQERQRNLAETRLSLEKKIEIAQKSVSSDTTEHLRKNIANIQQDISVLGKIQQQLDRIQDLITQHKDSQRAIKALEEKERLLTDLYRIFSKEIMIKVLEDALPFFAEYVNNLLAKMVQFSIHFQPKKTASDKLELEITIRDALGERNVKSLSGWQKAILRLAWILWVAQMTRTKQLFLDETINNIDHETISQVADMLQDYTKMDDIAIYLVTHSSQLQAMDIWDKVIELEKTN